jgi:hypothetical protein
MRALRKLPGRAFLIPLLLWFFSSPGAVAAEQNADEAAIRKLVDTYFTSWSKADFPVYRSLFRPNASLAFFESDRWQGWDLAKFLDEQESIQSEHKMQEIPFSVDLKALSGRAAFVEVSWRLFRTPQSMGVTGKDWFTLVKEGQDWKILNLTFWFDAPAPSPAK